MSEIDFNLDTILLRILRALDKSLFMLRAFSEITKEIDRLKCLNERFIQLEQLKENKVSDEKRLREIEIEQFTIMANQINAAMEQINDSIYSGKANAPLISFAPILKSYYLLTCSSRHLSMKFVYLTI